jgi:hypothetical protein
MNRGARKRDFSYRRPYYRETWVNPEVKSSRTLIQDTRPDDVI